MSKKRVTEIHCDNCGDEIPSEKGRALAVVTSDNLDSPFLNQSLEVHIRIEHNKDVDLCAACLLEIITKSKQLYYHQD